MLLERVLADAEQDVMHLGISVNDAAAVAVYFTIVQSAFECAVLLQQPTITVGGVLRGLMESYADLRALFDAAWQETAAVGRARGVKLPADTVDKIREFIGHAPPAMKASMAIDLERGNRLELPWLGGKVAELGHKLGVPTPTHSLMYAMLKPYIMGKPA